MSYIEGEGRKQGTLFPVVLDDLISSDHICRVIDAFVEKLEMSALGFERAKAADTGRPGYDRLAPVELHSFQPHFSLQDKAGRIRQIHLSLQHYESS
jgi:transposase